MTRDEFLSAVIKTAIGSLSATSGTPRFRAALRTTITTAQALLRMHESSLAWRTIGREIYRAMQEQWQEELL